MPLPKLSHLLSPLTAAVALGLHPASGLAQAHVASDARTSPQAGASHARQPALASAEMALAAHDASGHASYDFVADALRELGEADVALIDLARLQGSLARGDVTAARLRELLPWDGQLERYELSAAELVRVLHSPAAQAPTLVRSVRSGVAIRDDAGARGLQIAGQPLSPEHRYRLVLLHGAALAPPAAPEPLRLTLHESLERYLSAHPFLRANARGRVIAAELPAAVQCRDQLR